MSLHVNTGFAARYCDENGVWEDARVDDCESNEFRSIREMVGIKYKISSSITLESQLFSKKCVLLCICLCMVCIMCSVRSSRGSLGVLPNLLYSTEK